MRIIQYLFSVIIYVLLICCSSKKEKRLAKERIIKSHQIQLGMTIQEVTYVLGEPDTIVFFDQPYCCPRYLYNVNDDSFGSGEIRFDSLARVSKIIFPKNE